MATKPQKVKTPFDGTADLYEWALEAGETGDPLKIAPGKSDKTVFAYDVAGGSFTFQGTGDDAASPPEGHWFTLTDAHRNAISTLGAAQSACEVLQNVIQYRPKNNGAAVGVVRFLVTGR